MTDASNFPISQEWLRTTQQQDSPDTAIFYPSITTETFWANRFDTMAKDIEEAISGGENVTIVIYSLGAAEFIQAFMHFLDQRQKKNRENNTPFEPLDLSHINLVLRSPAGLVKTLSDQWRQVRRGYDLIKNSLGGPLVELEHVLTFAPNVADGTDKQTILAIVVQAFNQAYPEFSTAAQHPDKVDRLENIPLQVGPDHLDDEPFQALRTPELQQLDQDLIQAAQNVSADSQGFRDALTARTKYFKKHKALDKFFHNQDGVLMEEKPEKRPQSLVAGVLGLFRVIGRAVSPGNHEVYKWFESRGMKITALIPEHDLFVKLEDIEQFFSLTSEDFFTPASTHNTLTNRPNEFVEALKQLTLRQSASASSSDTVQ